MPAGIIPAIGAETQDQLLRTGREALAAADTGGFEELLRATSRPAETRTLPPAGDDTPPSDEEMERMEAAVRAHGCEILA